MQQTIWICDKCGSTIKDALFTVNFRSEKIAPKIADNQTVEASLARLTKVLESIKGQTTVHICKECMDKFTDGMCIVR